MTTSAPLCVLAAGGTGGHLFPAEALAQALLARGWRVILATDRRGMLFAHGWTNVGLRHVMAAPIAGSRLWRRLFSLAIMALGVLQARWMLARLKPRVIVGFGGYPSVPTVVAAAQGGVPILLHEQNAVMGRANRALAPRARRIALSFADTGELRDADRSRAATTGNPVRDEVRRSAGDTYQAPGDEDPIRLLITGGSQGARVFAEIVPGAVANLPTALRARLRVTQQARPEDLETVRAAYADLGVAAEVEAFFTDLPTRLATTHLAICRAGASTVAELTVAGVPAILVPLPIATDDHQTRNARLLEAAGAAWVMPQPDFQPPALARRLFNLLRDGTTLAAAAAAARAASHPDAAERLADLVQKLAA